MNENHDDVTTALVPMLSTTRRNFLRFSVGGVMISAAMLMVGCGGGKSTRIDNQTDTGRVQVNIAWPQRKTASEPSRYIPPYAQSIVLDLYLKADPENKFTQILNRPDSETSSPQTARFDQGVRLGTYVLVGRAYAEQDGGGAMVAQTQTEFEVGYKEIATPSLTLESVIDAIQIQGEPIQVKVGESLSLSGQALDSNGLVLLLPAGALSWSLVSGEAKASLSADGLLRGVATGAARVRLAEPQLNLSSEADVTVVSGATGLATSAWPKFRGDVRNTGRGVGSGAVGIKKWEFQVGSSLLDSSPSIGMDGTVFIGNDDSMYALDGETGEKKWQSINGGGILSSPAISADGTLYFGNADHNVYALDSTTGEVKWKFLTGGLVVVAPTIGTDGTVYIGSGDSKFYALDGATGAKKWEYLTGNGIPWSSPAIGINGIIYFGSEDKKLYALDSATGTKVWEFFAGVEVTATPSVGDDGTVYLGAGNRRLYAFDGATGVKKWETVTDNFVNETAIGLDGTVYAFVAAVFTAFDGATGAKKWEFLTKGGSKCGPAIAADGTIYVGGSDRKLYALDGATGAKKWEFLTGGAIMSSPAIGTDGTIYVGNNDAKVYAIR